jgi:hypothetical protein
MVLLLDLYTVLSAEGQTGVWGTGVYNGKHADPVSAARQLGLLGMLENGGMSAGIEKLVGLPELDIH